jgi:hypothetical protein
MSVLCGSKTVLATKEEYWNALLPGHVEWRYEIDGVGMARRYMPSAANQHEGVPPNVPQVQ